MLSKLLCMLRATCSFGSCSPNTSAVTAETVLPCGEAHRRPSNSNSALDSSVPCNNTLRCAQALCVVSNATCRQTM